MNTFGEKFDAYRKAIVRPFIKRCRLRFLNPDGTTAFALDNNPKVSRNKAFISNGSLSVNLQNGQRRSADIVLSNVGKEFSYNANNLWFGSEVAIDEGIVLPDGTDFYIQQGIFLLENPMEEIDPVTNTISYNLADKWANLDGRLHGYLEGTYEIPIGTNIFAPISVLLNQDKGNGYKLDYTTPIYTAYYNDKTQVLSDGTEASMTDTPYTLTVEGDGRTIADVILGLAEMLNAWIGYDSSGALRLDASQEDISDATKPVAWTFSRNDTTLLGQSYSTLNTEVYNDIIVVGEQLDDGEQPSGRAENLDPKSDTNINLIGRKTFRESKSGYGTDTMCQDYAVWKIKRTAVLQKSVKVSCSQIMHIRENELIEIVRTDKVGSPVERHLVQGFTRPLTGEGQMTIDAISVNDFPTITVTNGQLTY